MRSVLEQWLHPQLAAPAAQGFPVKPSEPAVLEQLSHAVPRAAPNPVLTFHCSTFVGIGIAFSFPLDPPDDPSILKQVLAFEIKQLYLKD